MNNELYFERRAHGELFGESGQDDSDRLDELRAADKEFLEKHPSASFLAELKARSRRRVIKRFNIIAGAAAACLAVVLLVPFTDKSDDGTRMKGADLNMFLYHKTEGGTEILSPETVLSEGDEVQVAYFVRDKAYAAIYSVDGRGKVTRHMPLHGADALEVDTGNFAVLPYSYKLDDAPKFEDLYLIVSPKLFKIDSLIPFLRAGFDNGTTELLLPSPFRFFTIRIRKSEATK